MELRGQDGGVHVDLRRIDARVRKPQDGEDDEGDGNRRNRREEHIADVREERDLIDRGRHYRGVRKRGDLVPEVGAGDDGTGDEPVGEAFGLADAQQGDADGGDGRPRTARHHGYDGADDAGGQEEDFRMDDLDPVIDEGRDHAAHRPGSGDTANEEKDQSGARHVAEVVPDGGLERFPGRFEQPGGENHAYAG